MWHKSIESADEDVKSITKNEAAFGAQMLWRKARKRGRTLRLRIGNVSKFLEQLNAMGIRYVVLRWFEEVPLDQASEAGFSQDIDFLMEHSRLDEVVRLAAEHPGGIKCDIYSPTGKRATGYKKMPYYPPVLGDEVLEHRVLYQDTFYVPEPDYFFKSLAYHLTYHKGTTSGIPSGTAAFPDCPLGKAPLWGSTGGAWRCRRSVSTCKSLIHY